MEEQAFNPKIDKYFTVQGFVINPSTKKVEIAHRKYNILDLRTITLEQAIELYKEKSPYLVPTEEGIKYLKENKEASTSRIAESEQQLKANEETGGTTTKKK